MKAQPDHLRLQPKRFPVDRVKVDFRKLLGSMGQALTRGTFAFFAPDPATAAGSAVNAGVAIFGAVEAFDADAPLEVRAWYLVRSALATALGQLLGELYERRGPFEGDLEHLDDRFVLLLEGDGAVIDGDFLDNPRTLKLLPQIRRVLEDWLATKVGLGVGDARALALRLDTHLAPALRSESRAHRDYYKPLYDHFEDRFAYAAQMEWDWERNRLALVQQLDDPVFEETFSLRQVYVLLRAYTLEEIQSDEPSGSGRKQRCRIFMLEDEIDAWLKHGRKAGDAIRLLTGGPGSGKSTFAKWLAAELSVKQWMRVLFIPLQRIRIQASLKDAIAIYLTETKRFQQSPLAQDGFASSGAPLLLVFDGLDELTKPGDLSDEQTKLFIEELRHHLGLWNERGVQVLALITGRTIYAQAKRPLLRIADRQEVAVLPYLVDADRKQELRACHKVSGEDLLKEDQREQWWRNYGLAKGFDDISLPAVFKNNHDLRELTADPLLNYLVVLSGFHKDLAGDTEVNRNRIYARLLKDVLDRRHAKRAEIDKVALAAVDEAKDRDDFERLLETVALAAWYGDGRTTTRAEIEKLLPKDLEPTWQELVAGGPGFTRLIAAFYIRQTEASAASDAVEFTHKSFGEYLTARRLVREIERICKGRHVSAEYYSVQQALEEWAKLTSAQAMTMELLRFVRDEVALRPKKAVQEWQVTFAGLLNLELQSGLPLSALPFDGFREAERRSRNAEETLLAAVNACARATKERMAIEWPRDTSASDMLHRLRGQRDLSDWAAGLDCLTRMCWPQAELVGVDLSRADLKSADLNHASLYGTNLSGSNLSCADLRGAHMGAVHMFDPHQVCSWRGANLSMADLSGADLREAYLGWADVSQADLRGTNVSGANLGRANFCEANFSGADLSGADLSGADLSGADLSGADLSGANLRGADLSGADLSGADLSGAKNLTNEQIKSARGITGAKLPNYLNHPGPRSRTRRTVQEPTP